MESTGMAGCLGINMFISRNEMKIKISSKLRVNLFGIQSMRFCPLPSPHLPQLTSHTLPSPAIPRSGRETTHIYVQ